MLVTYTNQGKNRYKGHKNSNELAFENCLDIVFDFEFLSYLVALSRLSLLVNA